MPQPVQLSEVDGVRDELFHKIRSRIPEHVRAWLTKRVDTINRDYWEIRLQDPGDSSNYCTLQIWVNAKDGRSWSTNLPNWILPRVEIPGTDPEDAQGFSDFNLEGATCEEIVDLFAALGEEYAK